MIFMHLRESLNNCRGFIAAVITGMMQIKGLPASADKKKHQQRGEKNPQVQMDIAHDFDIHNNWWAHQDSNLGPRDYESPALTD